jgi:glutathione S-transferase
MDLILYGVQLSPFVRKVEVTLREKGAEFELEPVNIMPMPDWFKEISPARRIPVLRDRSLGEDATLSDSSAICAYLERKFPEPALYPKGDFDYGRAIWLEEFADSDLAGRIGLGLFRPILMARMQKKEPDLDAVRKTMNEQLPRLLDYFEGEIAGREFFVGDAFSIADIAVASQTINLELVAGKLDAARWPQLAAFTDRIQARASFVENVAVGRKIVGDPVRL